MSKPEHIIQLEEFAKNMGVDLSKWELESDRETDQYSDENECRILSYRSLFAGEYTLYIVIENFDPPNWEIIEFQMAGD